MYTPTEKEKRNCIHIVGNIFNISNDDECKKYCDEIFKIAYSIGGDYSEKTLESIAEALIKIKN